MGAKLKASGLASKYDQNRDGIGLPEVEPVLKAESPFRPKQHWKSFWLETSLEHELQKPLG